MAILIVLQNAGLASEIGATLRRDGRVVKSCPSVIGPEFLKEFPHAEAIITDIVPPVLRFLSCGGKRLLGGPIPLLIVASRGHCASFTEMLRPGMDRCLPSDATPEFLESVRQSIQEMLRSTAARTEETAKAAESVERPMKRIAADLAHGQSHDRSTRKAMTRQVQFVSDIAHDLRSPLTAIGEFAELMRSGASGTMNEQQRRYVGIIERCCGEAARMVYDLLDGARLQSGQIHPHRQAIDLDGVFADVLESLEPAIRHTETDVTTTTPEGLPRVFGDRDMVGRIVANLVSNAIKFSPPRSVVTVRTERHSVSMARISVIDSGAGISREDLRRIFHRFEQGSNHAAPGIGLGLAIVRELVKLLGGRVTVESAPGRGSRFHFTLPLFLPAAILRRHLTYLKKDATVPATAWAFQFQDSAKFDAIHRLITASVRPRDLVLPEDGRRHILLVTQSRQPQLLVERMLRHIASYASSVPSVNPLEVSDLPDWLASVASRPFPSTIPPHSAQRAG
jgi:signal transduction histidine kinase